MAAKKKTTETPEVKEEATKKKAAPKRKAPAKKKAEEPVVEVIKTEAELKAEEEAKKAIEEAATQAATKAVADAGAKKIADAIVDYVPGDDSVPDQDPEIEAKLEELTQQMADDKITTDEYIKRSQELAGAAAAFDQLKMMDAMYEESCAICDSFDAGVIKRPSPGMHQKALGRRDSFELKMLCDCFESGKLYERRDDRNYFSKIYTQLERLLAKSNKKNGGLLKLSNLRNAVYLVAPEDRAPYLHRYLVLALWEYTTRHKWENAESYVRGVINHIQYLAAAVYGPSQAILKKAESLGVLEVIQQGLQEFNDLHWKAEGVALKSARPKFEYKPSKMAEEPKEEPNKETADAAAVVDGEADSAKTEVEPSGEIPVEAPKAKAKSLSKSKKTGPKKPSKPAA